MEDIAFNDWPGHVDLTGSNPWLPAYGFQQPASTILERDDFLGNPSDADLFLHGSAAQHYMYLETIQEETSDDLRSESDRSESRCSPVGWLDTNSESGSVIRIDIDECESDREVACPSKRRRQDNLLTISDDESCHSLSRSSSLIQFESLEKQCQEITGSSPSIFSYDSLEAQRKTDISPDSLDESNNYPSRDSLLYNATLANDSDDSSEGTLEAGRSTDNLRSWRSFEGLQRKEKMSQENLSEDSGYGDQQLQQLQKNKDETITMNFKKNKRSSGFSAYDGDVFQNTAWNSSVSFQDLSVVENFTWNRQKVVANLNIEKTSECMRQSKYNCASASVPNLPQAVVACRQQNACSKEEVCCVSSVPKDLNLICDSKWSCGSQSIAEKNWDLGDLKVDAPEGFGDEVDEMASFKREGSYLEAMSNLIDVSDDEHNPCYKDDIARSTIIEFDKRILKAISETSIKSFGDSSTALDLLVSSTPISSTDKRNVMSTPNLSVIKKEERLPNNPVHRVKRKSSLMNRSTSTSGVSDGEDKTLTRSGSCSSKGVHFSPVVSEVNWQDDSNSPDRESSYSLSSTPERERAPSPPTPPLLRPQPTKIITTSQPDLNIERQKSILTDKIGFAPIKTKSVSQPNLRRRSTLVRRDSDGALVKAYTDSDGVMYKHTHLDLETIHQAPPTPIAGHVTVNTTEAVGGKKAASVHVMESSVKPSRVGKLGGFFSRLASFRFSHRKNDGSKNKNKNKTNNNTQVVAQRLATKEDYIYIPLKGPERPQQQRPQVSVSSSKPPPAPRVVGASVKRQNAQSKGEERGSVIDSGATLPRPMEPMGLIETDLDTEVTVITSGAHAKTRSLMNLGAEAPPNSSSLAAPQHPNSRPHKSMEFLLDKQNLKVVEPPENELQKTERVMSEHQLRVQRSLQKLTIPDWYKPSQVPAEGFLLKKHREPRWTGTSLNSLGSSNQQSPTVLSPTPFVRWSTSKLNSTASSPCASTRSSFNARQANNGSVSPSSTRSSFNYRQPYMGWRSQERLTRRTPAERLASSLLTQQRVVQQQQQQQDPEIQTSIKEVTSAIVHYVSGLRPEQESPSPRGSQRLCWLESSFVGTKPLDSPQTPVEKERASAGVLRLDLQNHNVCTLLAFCAYESQQDVAHLKTSTATKPSPGSTTLEDVLDSLLGLPSSTRAPSPSLQETESANTSPTHLNSYIRRHSEGSEPSQRLPNHPQAHLLRCRYSRCSKLVSTTTPEAKSFKNCHNCSYTYCSRACRRAHWEKHRKTCLFSRVGALCRQVIAAAKDQPDTLLHISRIARRGYLSHGPGAVKCFFHCPEAAERFLNDGLGALGEPTYVPWPDLLPSEMGTQLYSEMVSMCRIYNADAKLILYVSICVVSEAPTAGKVKWERQLVSRCAKMRLSRELFAGEREGCTVIR